jgi:L-ascorbate metabolism protein UlaG (beta-lactamase superfamily)
MKACILNFLIFISLGLFAQSTESIIKTKKGPLLITPLKHATFTMAWNNMTIYVDPTGGAEAFENSKRPDIILITDIHGDHFDLKTLDAVVTKSTMLIVPQAVANLLPNTLTAKLKVLNNDESTKTGSLAIKAIPMYNLPEEANSMHVKGRGNGYLMKFANKKIYISGDTEDVKEMRNLHDVDAAFLCMNLPYTMNITQAVSATLDFKPKIVYPYHYRGKDGFSDVGKFKELINQSNPKIEVRLLK